VKRLHAIASGGVCLPRGSQLAGFWQLTKPTWYLVTVRHCTSNGAVLLAALALFVTAHTARADTLHLPIGGRSVVLSTDRILCPVPAAPFTAELGSRLVRPPTSEDAVGVRVEVDLAPSLGQCEGETTHLTLVAVGPPPQVDGNAVVFAPDEGRVEVAGKLLSGSVLAWESGEARGSDTCGEPRQENGIDTCTFAVPRGLSADPGETHFRVLPRGSVATPDAAYVDSMGRKVSLDAFNLLPARIVLSRLVMTDGAVDLSTGQGELPLTHPESVSSVDCGNVICEVTGGRVLVRGATSVVTTVEAKLKLAPHTFVQRKDALESQVSARFPVMRCPMSVVSGPPVRSNDDAKAIVRLDGRCAGDVAALKFVSQLGTARVLATANEDGAGYAVLRLGRFEDDHLTISALRGESEPVAVAVASTSTRNAPAVRATLELPGFPNLGFIPTNRAAAVHVSSAGDKQRFAVLPVEGAYTVLDEAPGKPDQIRASPHAAGLTPLRFGLRATQLPAGLDRVDLAIITDPLARDTIEANLPVPIEPTLERPEPLVEVLCGGGTQELVRVPMGDTAHLSFDLRDSCRVVFHRERLPQEYGTQKLRFEVEIVRSDGSGRPEGRVAETVTLRAGRTPRSAWISGIGDPFDRVIVRVFHVADEAHYIGASEIRTGAPAAQWSMVMGTGRVRLYGTTTIPTGLYRFTPKDAYSGVLSLNFGVISRLTWLDKDGKEGILGLEAGMLVFGLANSTSESGKNLAQVGGVVGAGIAVPIANRMRVTQASINVHAWLEITLAGPEASASRLALIFGPSITIGNVGANL
jgi:hypothetical protein